MSSQKKKKQRIVSYPRLLSFLGLFVIVIVCVSIKTYSITKHVVSSALNFSASTSSAMDFAKPDWSKPKLDTVAYDVKMMYLAHRLASSTSSLSPAASSSLDTSSLSASSPGASTTSLTRASSTSKTSSSTKSKTYLWPAKNAVYPLPGAILPFKRVVAYYGNLYAKTMGVLGQYEPDVMLQKLQGAVHEWELADPNTPVQPALHYIAVVAQGSAGADGKYRARMPDDQIDKVLEMAKKINAIVFLDIQVGQSNLQSELPPLEKYFKMPNVHLGIDPEFSMKDKHKPGTVFGTMDATDVNYAANYLAKLVRDNNLPPKILTFYRFTKNMITNYQNIETHPEVQMVMVMDGWGMPDKKIGTYNSYVYPNPVQFTGFKLFYKNDIKLPNSKMLTPQEVLKLTPSPSYIQYQ